METTKIPNSMILASILFVWESYNDLFFTLFGPINTNRGKATHRSECQVMRHWQRFIGYAHKTPRCYRHFVLRYILPISARAWFITSIRPVCRDTLFFHLSNYAALMCSFSPAYLLLPSLMRWHNSFWAPMSCRSTDANFLSSVLFKKGVNVTASTTGTHTPAAVQRFVSEKHGFDCRISETLNSPAAHVISQL